MSFELQDGYKDKSNGINGATTMSVGVRTCKMTYNFR